MSTLAERLQQAMTKRRVASQAEVARACKVSTASVSDWFSGETKTLGPKSARLAAEFFGCDRDWLAYGLGVPAWREDFKAAEPPTGYEARSAKSLDDALELLGQALANVAPEARDELGDALRQWAKYGGRATYRQTVVELLSGPHGKRQRAA